MHEKDKYPTIYKLDPFLFTLNLLEEKNNYLKDVTAETLRLQDLVSESKRREIGINLTRSDILKHEDLRLKGYKDFEKEKIELFKMQNKELSKLKTIEDVINKGLNTKEDDFLKINNKTNNK